MNIQKAMALAVLVALLAACGDGAPAAPDVLYLAELQSSADFERLQGEGEEVKYLTSVDGRDPVLPEECAFQNTAKFVYHIEFLRAAFAELRDLNVGAYTDLVLSETTRRMWGGGLKHYGRIRHPKTGDAGIYTYFVYESAGGAVTLSVDEVSEVDGRLKGCAPFAADRLVYVPTTPAQVAFATAHLAEFTAADVTVMFSGQLIEKDYDGYSLGENYGYLHIVPEGQALDDESVGARDVVIVEAAPADITLVAGLITTLPQNVHSHTNLRLREKAIPNALFVDAYDTPAITALANKLVHIVTTKSKVTVEAADLEDAEAFWEAHRPVVGDVMSDLSITAFGDLAALRHADAIAYGVKAANIGELISILPEDNRVSGFAIPFATYDAFATESGIADDVTALLADTEVDTDRAHRNAALATLRDAIKDADFPADLLQRLTDQVHDSFGAEGDTLFLRFRSSTNAEDLDVLSGAGLYDSKTGCLGDDLDDDEVGPSVCLTADHKAYLEANIDAWETELADHPDHDWLPALIDDAKDDLTDEKTVADAIRKVWASLWNLRAFDEREYYGIDHRDVYMGMAVEPTFVMEKREAVVVTNLEPDAADGPLYRVVSQLGEVGVVRPSVPTAVAETMTFRRDGAKAVDVDVVVPSSLSPGGAALWTAAETKKLASLLFTIQDHFAANVYPTMDNLRLDLEVEVTRDNRIVIKQARPYLGVEP